MREKEVPYCIPHKRNLSFTERALLKYLLRGRANLLEEIEKLKVVARCGCGKCPTVLFGRSFDAPPVTGSFENGGEAIGRAVNGTLVGVVVLLRNGRISELEAWSVDGGDIQDWPTIEAIENYQGSSPNHGM